MIHFSHYESGALFGVRYRFEHAGDEIPVHSHPASTAHNICVMKGSVAFESGSTIAYLKAGEIFDFDGTKPHSITALEPAEIFNGFLHGKPAEYANLTDSDKHGVM